MAPVGAFVVLIIYSLAIIGVLALAMAFSSGWRPSKISGLLIVILFSPIVFLAVAIWQAERRGTEWLNEEYFTSTLQEAITEYYYKFPSKFKSIRNDEKVELIDFDPWLEKYVKERKKNYPEVIRVFKFKNGCLIDKQGNKVKYVMDLNRDKWISVDGKNINVGGVNPFEKAESLPDSDKYLTTLGIVSVEAKLIHSFGLYKN